jgi:hypothetical protein
VVAEGFAAEVARRCKTVVELDRNAFAEEQGGYSTALIAMANLEGYSKVRRG